MREGRTIQHLPTNASLRDDVVATINAARMLLTLLQSSTLDFGKDDRAITGLMDRRERDAFFSPADDARLVTIASHACAGIAARYPTWSKTLGEGRVPEEPFGDLDAELARKLLEAVCNFRRLRQRVFDEALADRLLYDLQRRR